MGIFNADQNKLLFKYESGTYAAASGDGQWIGLVQSHTPTDEENVTSLRYLGTADRNVDTHVDGALDHGGNVTYHPQDWKFLAFALGSNVDGGAPTPFTHTISESNTNDGNYATSGTRCPFVSFTLEDSRNGATNQNFVRTYGGCVVNSLAINASQGEMIECEMEYFAQSCVHTSGTSTTVTASTTRPFLWSDVKVFIPSGTLYEEITDFGFTVNNNIERRHYLNGSRVIGHLVPGNRDYELTLTADGVFDKVDSFYNNYFKSGTEFNMIVDFTDVGAGAGSRDMLLTLSGCRITSYESEASVEGVNEVSMTITPKSASALVNDTIQSYNAW